MTKSSAPLNFHNSGRKSQLPLDCSILPSPKLRVMQFHLYLTSSIKIYAVMSKQELLGTTVQKTL